MKFDVVGFGALNVDKLYRVDEIARIGEERFITGCIEAPGGSAANTIVGLARLENSVGYIGKVGGDREKELLFRSFHADNVDTKGLIVAKGERSGSVIGFVDRTGERTMYVNPGANDTLGWEEVDKEYASQAKFLHLTSFVGEKPFEAQKKLVQNLPEIRVSLDPGSLYARKGLAALRPLLRRSFIIFPNESELRHLTGKDYRKGAKILLKDGANIVAVKLGAEGCYVAGETEQFLIDAFPVRVVDTTGAGDAFCAGFLHGLLRGKDLYACGRIANFVASRKIETAGARAGLPRLTDLLNSERGLFSHS